MKIFFIRHGETVDNVAGLLAGSLDSALSNHGFLQNQRLGKYLADQGLSFTHIYASDKQRALMTAEAISHGQRQKGFGSVPQVIQLHQLRERDFGSMEGVSFLSRAAQDALVSPLPDSTDQPTLIPKETEAAMAMRAKDFVDNFLIPLLATDEEDGSAVAVTSHGIFLTFLWREFFSRFRSHSVSLAPGVRETLGISPIDTIRMWANTGYIRAEVQLKSAVASREPVPHPAGAPTSQILTGYTMLIKVVNSTEHLNGLKRTGGGVGSAKYDPRQKSIQGFFKKK